MLAASVIAGKPRGVIAAYDALSPIMDSDVSPFQREMERFERRREAFEKEQEFLAQPNDDQEEIRELMFRCGRTDRRFK
jgi:hypothetical protein